MNIDFTAEELAFRDEVRGFLETEVPAYIKEKVANGIHLVKDDHIVWQKALHQKGWAGVNWPVEHGGTGWSSVQKYIFSNECAEYHVPGIMPFGLSMVAPVIYSFGNDEQKQRFLPDILASNVWWCQGYSEPNSGSDLASLKTTATRDGDDYIVNGTKTWTTLGQYADWIFCLVRTAGPEVKAQQGISFLLIDMKTPGISVNPIIMLDGHHEVNEVFFDNVRVPAENLIGEENKGWTYAKVLLTHERTGIANVATSKARLKGIKALAARTDDGEATVADDPVFQNKLAALEIRLNALEYTELRTLAAVSTGNAPGPESSVLKIEGTRITQALDEFDMEVAGYYSVPFIREQFMDGFDGEAVGPGYAANTTAHYFNNRKISIYGGSNEIQMNIICKAVLGL